MIDTHHGPESTAKTRWGAPNSTYVRTTIRIRNTYIHTYLLEANALDFDSIDFRQINAYCNTLSRGWW